MRCDRNSLYDVGEKIWITTDVNVPGEDIVPDYEIK